MVGVANLGLQLAGDVILEVADAEDDAGVTFGLEGELHLEDEASVCLLGGEAGVVALPALLAFARAQRDDAVLDDPVAGGCQPVRSLLLNSSTKPVSDHSVISWSAACRLPANKMEISTGSGRTGIFMAWLS